MIPDQGNLSETAPAKLLLALYEQNQTGILYFRQNEILKVFYLNHGRLSWAISSDDADKIEHILLSSHMVSSEMLAPYQSSNKITESFGKILVENGILSFENLISATRDQVRHIANSVMRWTKGSYQLVQESPPTRLVSLELEIPGIVAGYVLSQMDVNIIWEELGALAGELEQTPDPGKKNLYALDAEQQEVYSCFREPQSLESVLLKFPAERKYRILKILYFFLLTGLLSKKEAEKMPSLDFNELDSLFGQSPPGTKSEVDIEMPAMIDEAAIKDIPLSELPDIPAMKTEANEAVSLPELPDLMPPGSAEANVELPEIPEADEEKSERPKIQPFLRPEKPKPRWRSITFLSILLCAVIIGLFLWLTRGPGKSETNATTAPASQAAPEKQPPQEFAEPEQKTETPAVETLLPASDAARQPAETGPAPENKPPAAEKEPPASVEKKSEPTVSGIPAQQQFAAGNFRAAGDAWRSEMISMQVKFSILLEMDCLKESVDIAHSQVEDKGNFFLLNKTSRDGRNCWLVLWGRYRTADEATLALKLVPQYFWKQSEPPSVIDLKPYL